MSNSSISSNSVNISTQSKYKYSLIVKTFLLQSIQFSQTVLIQTSQFSQTVLIQTIQFSMIMQLFLYKLQIGPYQVLQFRARLDLGAMAMMMCTSLPKAPASLKPHHQIF